jgi:sec-independent protein translocase protein TatA
MPGPLELAIVLGVVLLIFGPKRLPDMGRSIGGGMRSFKSALTGGDDDEPIAARLPEAQAAPKADTRPGPA